MTRLLLPIGIGAGTSIFLLALVALFLGFWCFGARQRRMRGEPLFGRPPQTFDPAKRIDVTSIPRLPPPVAQNGVRNPRPSHGQKAVATAV